MIARRSAGRPGRPPGGSDAIVERILHEAAKQLGAAGYDALRVEDVARAAGVNKTTIYRRWPTKGRLVVAAIHAMRERTAPFAPTGDLRADLVAILAAKAKNVASPRGRKIAQALVALGEADAAEVAEAMRDAQNPTPASLVADAMARGELPVGDARFAGELLAAPVMHRLLVLNQPVDRAFVERVVDHVLATLRGPGAAAPPRRTPKKQQSLR